MPSLPLLLRPFLRKHTPSTSPARGADSEVLRQEEVRPEGLRNASITGLARSLSRYKAWKHSGMTSGDHGHRRPGLKRFLLGGGTVYVPGGGRHSDAPQRPDRLRPLSRWKRGLSTAGEEGKEASVQPSPNNKAPPTAAPLTLGARDKARPHPPRPGPLLWTERQVATPPAAYAWGGLFFVLKPCFSSVKGAASLWFSGTFLTGPCHACPSLLWGRGWSCLYLSPLGGGGEGRGANNGTDSPADLEAGSPRSRRRAGASSEARLRCPHAASAPCACCPHLRVPRFPSG